jgi:hypothetical protein
LNSNNSSFVTSSGVGWSNTHLLLIARRRLAHTTQAHVAQPTASHTGPPFATTPPQPMRPTFRGISMAHLLHAIWG